MAFNSGFSGGSKVCPLYGGGTAANPANILVMQAAPPAAVANQPGENPIGTIWINVLTGNTYQLVQNTYALGQVWTLLGGAAAAVATINSLTPTGGNIIIAGTANQITATSAVSTITLSLPSALVAPGSFTATSGAITATNGNVVLGTAGNKLVSTSVASTTTAGANSFGTVTLVNGSATVNTTAVTASSIIMLVRQSIGATGANPIGDLSVGTIVANTSFVINSAGTVTASTPVATDVSIVGWMIIN